MEFILSPLLSTARYLAICGVLFSLSLSSHAQTSNDLRVDQIQQQEQLRRENEQRRIDRAQRQRAAESRLKVESSEGVELKKSGPCFPVEQIQLDGVTVFSPEQQSDLLAPLQGSCLGKAEINSLLDLITKTYFDAGFITSRAYIGEQDLSSGNLIVKVVEGKLEQIKFIDNKARDGVVITAFPDHKNVLFNLRALEQGIENINRLASVQAKMNVLPGSFPGGSSVDLDYQAQWPITTRLSYDNSGQASTGERQAGLFVGYDNLFGVNDYQYLSFQTDTADDSDGMKSESIAWHYDMPFGYWNLSFDASRFKYVSIVDGIFESFETSGKSSNYGASLGRVLHRDKDSVTRLSTGLLRKESDNYIEDVVIQSSTRRLAVANLNIAHTQYLKSGQFNAGLTYHRGLKIFGSPNDDNQSSDGPKAQFDKFTLDADYRHNIDIYDTPVVFTSRLKAQYSPDELYGTEHFSVGGQYTVRGYKEFSLSSNNGGYWRNEVAASFYPKGMNGDVFTLFRPFIGLDIGVIRDGVYSDDYSQYLSGWATGFGLHGDHISVDVTYSEPMDSPDFSRPLKRQVYFSAAIKF